MTEKQQCGSCGEPIYWLTSDKTGKPAPIEVKTDPKGNIVIAETIYHIVPATLRDQAAEKYGLHLNHFATCPQSKVWKKAGRS